MADSTIVRILSRIEPEQFRLCFVKGMHTGHKLSYAELIAIGGKTQRSSYQRSDRQSTIRIEHSSGLFGGSEWRFNLGLRTNA